METPKAVIEFLEKNYPTFNKVIDYSNGYSTGKPEHYVEVELKSGRVFTLKLSDATLAAGSFPRYETIEAGSFERS